MSDVKLFDTLERKLEKARGVVNLLTITEYHQGKELADDAIRQSTWAVYEYLNESLDVLREWESRTSQPRRAAE